MEQQETGRVPLWWHRAVATGFSLLFIVIAFWTCWIIYSEPRPTDFLSYWAASKLALSRIPEAAYDIEAHRAVQSIVATPDGLLPFPYPPPFLIFLIPLGFLAYPAAFALWVATSGALYVAVSRTMVSWRYALAHPSASMTALIGQNGFLTAALFVGGAQLLRRRPLAGGAILGLLVIKPQLGLLLPLALVAGRQWKAIGGAVLSASLLLVAALIAFGPESYAGFLNLLPQFARFISESRWPWNEFASAFAFLRYFGVSEPVALAIHAFFALAGAVATWIAWSRDWPERVPILATATILIPPYLLTYDALLLIVPIAYWINRGERPGTIALVWLFCALPVAQFFGLYSGPNTVPLAATIALLMLLLPRIKPRRGRTATLS